jgi:hypothetical protein
MTPQEAFDIASKHLLTQMCKSEEEPGNCLYRGPNGLMCGIGPLIKDEDYSPKMEGSTVSGIIASFHLPYLEAVNIDPVTTLVDDESHDYLLNSIQFVHDHNDPYTWRERLERVAYIYGLKFNA